MDDFSPSEPNRRIDRNRYSNGFERLKKGLAKERREVVTECHQLKLTVADGKQTVTDVVTDETLPCNGDNVELRDARESVHSQDFNYGEFATIKSQARLNSYKTGVKEGVAKTGANGSVEQAQFGRDIRRIWDVFFPMRLIHRRKQTGKDNGSQ